MVVYKYSFDIKETEHNFITLRDELERILPDSLGRLRNVHKVKRNALLSEAVGGEFVTNHNFIEKLKQEGWKGKVLK